MIQSATGLAICLMAVSWLSRAELGCTWTPLGLPLVLFGSAVALLGAISTLSYPEWVRSSLWHHGLRAHLFLWANGILIFFWAAQFSEQPTPALLDRIPLAVVGVAAGYAVLQHFGIDPVWAGELKAFAGRPLSTFGNPNFLSTAIVLLLPLVLNETLGAESRWKTLLWGGLGLLYGSALLLTQTRSSWIGAVFGLALLVVLDRRGTHRGRLWVWMGVAAAATVLLSAKGGFGGHAGPLGRLRELWTGILGTGPYGPWHQRLLIWGASWDLWASHPVVGAGWGSFEVLYPFHQSRWLFLDLFRGFRTHANNAHNLVFEVGSQTGILGLGLLIWVLANAARLYRHRVNSLPEGERRWSRAAVAGLAGVGVDNVFGNVSLFFAVPAFLSAWVLGRWASRLGSDSMIYKPRPPLRWGLSAALLLASLGLAGDALAEWMSERLRFQGVRKAEAKDWGGAVRLLERSRSWKKLNVRNDYELGNSRMRLAFEARERGLPGTERQMLGLAAEAYARAVAANPGYDEIFFNRAGARQSLGLPREAAQDYRMSALLNPLRRPVYDMAALGPRDAWPPNARRGLLEQGTRLFPRDKALWLALARELEESGLPLEAGQALTRALRLDLDLQAGWAALERLGIPPEESLQRARRSLDRAREMARRGEWVLARREAEILSQAVPENSLAALMRADLAAQAKDWVAADASYARFLEWEPQHRVARLNRLTVLRQLDRPDEARRVAESLRRDFPGDPEISAATQDLTRLDPAGPGL